MKKIMMTNQITKKQHHFPQMMLRKFLDNENKLHMFDEVSGNIKYQTTETVAYQNHLYTIHYEKGKDDSLEKKFSEIESRAVGVLERFLSGNSSTLDDCKFVVEFVAILMMRTPQNVNIAEEVSNTEKMAQILRSEGKNRGVSEKEIEDFITELISQKGFGYAVTFSDSIKSRVEDLINHFDLKIVTIEDEGHYFMVSDNYATYEPLPNLEIKEGNNDWYNLPIHIHCPLSSNKCLTFIPKENKEDLNENLNWSYGIIDKQKVDHINQLTFHQKNRYVYSQSREQIEALIDE